MSQPKPLAPEPTDIAERYQVVKKLGAGAFGTVYKARDRVLGRMVAIKTIRMDGLAAAGAPLEELLERFEREAQVSAQLRHPHIVTIHDIGKAGDLSYLAMEFIDGVGLEKVIATDKRLGVERAASIAAQVADALDFAHRNGVVHRDIKPANIMIEDGDRVKVTDFGIAKVIDSGDHLTVSGSLLGTPSYMSPEQARGVALDGRSDLFAVGCIFYEMIAGQKAFRGDSITGLIFKIITEEPTPLQQLVPGLSEELLRVVNKALAKTPEARYQTGRELKDDLQRLAHAGVTPTVRIAEAPTSPAGTAAVAPDAATLNSPLTAAGAPPTQVAPPTRGSAGTLVAPPPPQATIPPRITPPPAGAARPARKGVGVGVILAVLAFGGLVLLGSAVGGWYLFVRQPATTDSANATDAGGGLAGGATPDGGTGYGAAGGNESASDGTSSGDTAAPFPGSGTDAGTAGGDYERETAPGGRPRSGEHPHTTAPAERGRPATAPAPEAQAPVEALPYVGPDPQDDAPSGREAGRRVAEAYRSKQRGFGDRGDSEFGTSGRFRARPRVPPGLGPVERAAAGVLLQIHRAEEQYHRQQGSYGSLEELRAAGALRLNAPQGVREFIQDNYHFALSTSGDAYEAHATPRGAGLRPLRVDDSGFVLFAED